MTERLAPWSLGLKGRLSPAQVKPWDINCRAQRLAPLAPRLERPMEPRPAPRFYLLILVRTGPFGPISKLILWTIVSLIATWS
jgi:hypothetical protein